MTPLLDGPFFALYGIVLLMASIPLGWYIAWVLHEPQAPTSSIEGKGRRILRRLGIDLSEDMTWKQYLGAVLVFNGLGLVVTWLVQMYQHLLPWNPAHLPAVRWDTALNTALSFVTNTNWQSYSGETTMSYGTQMTVLTTQNFLSASTGIAVFAALVRSLARAKSRGLGNFWRDLGRILFLLLLPLSIILSLALMHEGVVQNFDAPVVAHTREGGTQILPQGPAASQIAIKQLGTNGGGFFGVNSAHPYENPTPVSNVLQLLAILLLPSALVFAFGRMIHAPREAWVLWGVMAGLTALGVGVTVGAEHAGNPLWGGIPGLEGQEWRFGSTSSFLWSVVTAAASNGSVNMMHGSLSPLASLVALGNMLVGEVLFGGVGSGMYGMLVFVILTIFLAGLMVGRTPEYLGKRIESFEVKMAVLAVLAPTAVILLGIAASLLTKWGTASMSTTGPHGFTELLYAYTSAGANNGSAFAGFLANVPFHNVALGIAMLVGRFGVIIPVLALAGNMVEKGRSAAGAGTFRTNTLLFGMLLASVIVVVGGLTFFPALALGPVVEHVLIQSHVAW